jgi:hypothetical protein
MVVSQPLLYRRNPENIVSDQGNILSCNPQLIAISLRFPHFVHNQFSPIFAVRLPNLIIY